MARRRLQVVRNRRKKGHIGSIKVLAHKGKSFPGHSPPVPDRSLTIDSIASPPAPPEDIDIGEGLFFQEYDPPAPYVAGLHDGRMRTDSLSASRTNRSGAALKRAL